MNFFKDLRALSTALIKSSNSSKLLSPSLQNKKRKNSVSRYPYKRRIVYFTICQEMYGRRNQAIEQTNGEVIVIANIKYCAD